MQLQLSFKVALISVAGTLMLACGSSSSPSTNESPNNTAGTGPGIGGSSALAAGGSSGSPAATTSSAGTPNNNVVSQGGSAGQPITVGGGGNTAPAACAVGAIRCNGNVREQSTQTCDWVPLSPELQCTGATPACTGAGLCAAYRLVQGTIDTFGPVTGSTSASYILTHQTLLEYPTACNQKYCVSGGIQP